MLRTCVIVAMLELMALPVLAQQNPMDFHRLFQAKLKPEAPAEPAITQAKPKSDEVSTIQPLPLAEQQTLLDRGDSMLNLGDVSSARLLYQRAADAGVAIAAFKLATTYDPAFIAERNLRGIKPDWQQAVIWYRTAKALGDPRAETRLQSLLSNR